MINKLIQSAKEKLQQKGFTELTIRMNYCRFWNPLAAYFCETAALDVGSLSDFSVHRYGADVMGEGTLPSKRLMRAKHAFQVLLAFQDTGSIISCPMSRKRIRYKLDVDSQAVLDGYLSFRSMQDDSFNTLDNKRRTLHDFLLEIPLDKLSKNTIGRYLSQSGGQLSKSSMKTKAGIIRQFLTYCREQNLVREDFSVLFPAYRSCSGLGIPSAYKPEELQLLLQYLKTSTKRNGKRDYAMVLLMLTYGFRARDIATLKLSDIDWQNSSIHLIQSKTKECWEASLTRHAGNALADYILNFRPRSGQPNVFLKSDGTAIVCPSTVSTAVSMAFLDSGVSINGRRHGSHSLRHSLASSLLDEGTGIFEIARILGHSSADSTRIYTKINIEKLRLCELEVPSYE